MSQNKQQTMPKFKNNMTEIRLHGRGGQGVVTGAELLAIAGFFSGLEGQAFPLFGVERTGAPIMAFARLSKKPIILKEQIYHPDFLIIQDNTLLSQKSIFAGISDKTLIVINSPKNPKELAENIFQETGIKIKEKNIFATPATEIALRILGKNIVNTVILGAFAKASGLINLKSLEKAIAEKFQDKGEKIVQQNINAIKEAYEKQK